MTSSPLALVSDEELVCVASSLKKSCRRDYVGCPDGDMMLAWICGTLAE